MNEPLDKFGQFIIENLRDKQIDNFKGLLEGKWRAKNVKELQNNLSKFNRDEKKVIADLVEDILTNTLHDFLFAIQENNDLAIGLKIMMDNENVAELSDGLHMEIFDEDGWVKRFSKYKSIQ
ncbi:hypothetical protein [Cellulophaga tyrosinoxydans]|uniref:Uncharacterized protein n=1 Tax=Cellulophaga tyrosinoxydans TaxID=504486 RepID=A0A1W2CRQ3_9FLAO|nr:hypothetical protein [Cellulophaga tyrosinoxydans]SMC87891.1 hypothetical protein SAMN05660703_3166 [Cellulophaga tyrosinoxydans]